MRNNLWILIFVVAFAACYITPSQAEIVEGYIIAHTHCDPGWLRTIDEYYASDVRSIMTNVLSALREKNHRKFMWSEISFFEKWYEESTDETREQLKQLIAEGRFEFVGAGWVQNDEACPEYASVIDQVTLGHEFVLKRFGVRPKIAWQIDPFGHSAVTPYLFSKMGYEALVVNRVHHGIKSSMKSSQALEFVWKVENSEMFTHVLHTHYSAPVGFDFEGGVGEVTPGSEQHRASQLADIIKQRAAHYRTGHVLVPFGDDFKFRDANIQFRNMDILISTINANPDRYGVRLRYATPSEYFDAIVKAGNKFPVVESQDFFPYADNEDAYWTGFYTTRPLVKLLTRQLEAMLRSTELLYALARSSSSAVQHMAHTNWLEHYKRIESARKNMGLVLHHDGITGTSRAHVVSDYQNRLRESLRSAGEVSRKMISLIMSDGSAHILESSQPLEKGQKYTVVIQNPLSVDRSSWVRLRCKPSSALVRDGDGKTVSSQTVPVIDNVDSQVMEGGGISQHDLYFLVSVPAFGMSAYEVSPGTQGTDQSDTEILLTQELRVRGRSLPNVRVTDARTAVEIENDRYVVKLSGATGFLEEIRPTDSKTAIKCRQSFSIYTTSNSGAYIFRPLGDPSPTGTTKAIIVSKGPFVHQAHVVTDKMQVSIRVFRGPMAVQDHIEVFHNIYTLEGNTELVTKFDTDIRTNGVFYSLNGLNFHKRVRESNPSAGMFYPTYNGVMLRGDSGAVFSIMPDYSTGHSYRQEGELEIMMHRRLLNDDGRGMSEGNNDDTSILSTMWITLLSPSGSQAATASLPSAAKEPKTEGSEDEDDLVSFADVGARLQQLSHNLNFPLLAYLARPEKDKPFNIAPSFEPLQGRSDLDHVRILSFFAKDQSSDDLVVRLQNLHPTEKIVVPSIQSVLGTKLTVRSARARSLNLVFDEQEAHNKRKFPQQNDQKFKFSPTTSSQDLNDANQNSAEAGVFLSDAAMAMDKRGLRSLPSSEIVIPRADIKTFVVTLDTSKELALLPPLPPSSIFERPSDEVHIPVVNEKPAAAPATAQPQQPPPQTIKMPEQTNPAPAPPVQPANPQPPTVREPINEQEDQQQTSSSHKPQKQEIVRTMTDEELLDHATEHNYALHESILFVVALSGWGMALILYAYMRMRNGERTDRASEKAAKRSNSKENLAPSRPRRDREDSEASKEV